MAKGMAVDGPDVGGGPDLAAIGASARGSKSAGATPPELTTFSVKKGDNGGVIVCETYEKKPPAGRRYGASYPGGGDYKENPFSPSDSAGAMARVTDLLGQMGVSAPAPEAPPEAPDVPSMGGGPMVAPPGPEGY